MTQVARDGFRAREAVLPSVVEAMAATPLVALDRLTAGVDGRILAKLDYLLPGFSKKDRAARRIIENAERSGELKPGQCVVELTSGNMGTGLAIVCAVRGYPFVAVMSTGNSAERARMMRALGAEVVLVPQAPGSRPGEVSGADLDLVEAAAQSLAAERGAFRADQFLRAGNPEAHRDGTAPEIWLQSGGRIDAFCDFAGSAGTLAGCAAFFRAAAPRVKCYAVEPEGAEAIAGGDVSRPDHPIQGGGYLKADLEHLGGVALAGHLKVPGSAARDMTRRLAREEGIFAGFSSGANVAAALQLLAGPLKGGSVAVVICDSGLKYLSTDLWTDEES
jgi:cysteine synthase A